MCRTHKGDIEELTEVWETLHICFDRSERCIMKALYPLVKFNKYKMSEYATIRKFKSLL
jgi:hypothetical protein